MSEAIAKADALLALGRPEEAKRVLRQALEQQPEEFELLVRLAQAEHQIGNHREALRVAGLASAADPESFWPHEIRAHVFMARRKGRAALAAAEEALRLNPIAMAGLEVLALLRRDVASAREAADRLVTFYPESGAAHRAMGRVCERERDLAAAEKHYREALRLEPENVLMMMQLGWFLIRRANQRSEGVALLHLAAKTDPTNKDARQLFLGAVPQVDDGTVLLTGFTALVLLPLFLSQDLKLMMFPMVAIVVFLAKLWLFILRRSVELTPEAEKFLEQLELSRRNR